MATPGPALLLFRTTHSISELCEKRFTESGWTSVHTTDIEDLAVGLGDVYTLGLDDLSWDLGGDESFVGGTSDENSITHTGPGAHITKELARDENSVAYAWTQCHIALSVCH